MQLPPEAPWFVDPLLDGLIRELGSLVPVEHAERIRRAWGSLAILDVGSIGLEISLAPGAPACDASVLLSPASVPPGLDDQKILLRLAAEFSAWHRGTVWWELDTSRTPASAGVFLRTDEDQSSFERLQSAVSDQPGLVRALAALEPWHQRWGLGAEGLIGVFPERTPPAAGMLLPLLPEHISPALARLSEVAACVSADEPLLRHLRDACTRFSIAIGADAQGRMSVSLEASFTDRENAMLRGEWNSVLEDSSVWGCGPQALQALLDTQGHRRYDTFPPMIVLTGIDHLKVGPGGRTKAYVGALPLSAAGVKTTR